MDAITAKFGWIPLSDSLALADQTGNESNEVRFSKIKQKWTIVQSRESMTSPKYHQLETSSKETIKFSMPNVLHLEDSNTTNDKSSEYLCYDADVEDYSMSDSISSFELFPWPAKGLTIPEDDDSTEQPIEQDNRKALFLALQLNLASLVQKHDDGINTGSKHDIYIHVFLNGSLCNSKFIRSNDLERIQSGYCAELFHGMKYEGSEKAWIVGQDSKATSGDEKEKRMGNRGSVPRWNAINQKLASTAYRNSEDGPAPSYLSEFISALANLPVPREGLSMSNNTFAVIDVIVVGGSSLIVKKKNQDRNLLRQVLTLHGGDGSSDDEMYDLESVGVNEALGFTNSNDNASTGPQPMSTDSRGSQDESNVTSHTSNLTALWRREQRPAREIAQFANSGQRRGGKRRRAISSDGSIASLHSSPAPRSLNSGPTNSVVWSSTSSEVIRQRQAKGDLSLPRKKRRRNRYKSPDFDSEDPVAVIPDKLESKIRIVPRNEKPAVPAQKKGKDTLRGRPASRLVRPVVHRNLRKKRARQIVKRNPEVGLTERDMYNWIMADYEARDGKKPWLESQDHEHVPRAQPLGRPADQAPANNAYGSNWDILKYHGRIAAAGEDILMQDSIVTVSPDIVRSARPKEEIKFECEKVLMGTRFIFV